VKTTYRIHFYRPMDGDAVERWLHRKALRGLRLEKAGQFVWRFRRTEPAPLTYAVTYFPDASVYGGAATPQQEEYAEYCAAAGWDYVTQWHRMQIFVTDREDPIPLETDPHQKLDTIRQIMRKDTMPLLLLLALCLLQIWLTWQEYRVAPIAFLSSPVVLPRLLAYPLLSLTTIMDQIAWRLWLRRSERSVAAGGDCVPSLFPLSRWLGIGSVVVVALAFCQMIGYALQMDAAEAVLYGLGTALAIMLAIYLPMWWMREHGYGEKAIRKTTLIITVVVVVVFTFGAVALMGGGEEIEPAYWYETADGDRTYGIYDDPIPLTLADLGAETDGLPYSRYFRSLSSSPLVERTQASEHCPPEKHLEGEFHDLFYSIYRIKLPFLRDLCRNELLRQTEFSPAEDFRWQAEELYIGPGNSSGAEYMAIWGSTILFLRTDIPLDDAAIGAIRSAVLN